MMPNHIDRPWTKLVDPLLDDWLSVAERIAPEADRDMLLQEGALLWDDWTQQQRVYHTPHHLFEMLDAIEELALAEALVPEVKTVAKVIAWYHDVHYDPTAQPGSNEHRSATMARDHLHRLGVAEDVVDAVEEGILMTAEHDSTDISGYPGAGAVVHDADLWILSSPRARYAHYTLEVREEYHHVPESAFIVGRREIVKGFVERERIYRTDHAHREWDEQARDNLSSELGVLDEG